MPENLLPRIGGAAIDHYELLRLIGFHYGGSCSTEDDRVIYPCVNSYSLKVHCEDGEILSIEPGPGFSESDFGSIREKVQTQLVDSSGIKIRACVLFSSKAANGYFRTSSETIQILPPPHNAPLPPVIIADHPFILEFPIKSSTNGFVTNMRAMRYMLEWTWTLNALLRTPIKCIGPRTQHLWALIQPEPNTSPNQSNVKWVQEFYAIDGLRVQLDDFSIPTATAITQIAHDEYYHPRFLRTDSLVLPDSFSRMLGQLGSLSAKERQKFRRAAQWIYAAHALWEHHTSSYFIALVAAVEALMPPPGQSDSCTECGKDRSPGPTQRFQDFVEEYAPVTDQEERNRKWLYKIRSDLAHGRDLLRYDAAPWDSSLSTSYLKELEAFEQMSRIVRWVIVNWLLTRQSG